MNREKLEEALLKRGYRFSYFQTGAEAAEYLDRAVDGETVGIGGSVTIREIGLYERLSLHNDVFWHWIVPGADTLAKARDASVYFCSLNGVAETGELINIDGNGNRLAATLEGHRRVYLVVGENKVTADYESALWRARNIASPKNAQRLSVKTPCAARADRCYDCESPERICKALSVFWKKPAFAGEVEVVLVGEPLGY